MPLAASYGCREIKKIQPKFCEVQNFGWILHI